MNDSSDGSTGQPKTPRTIDVNRLARIQPGLAQAALSHMRRSGALRGISHVARELLSYMADMGFATGFYFAGRKLAAHALDCDVRTIGRATEDLQRAGLLRLVGVTSRRANVWRLEFAFRPVPTRTEPRTATAAALYEPQPEGAEEPEGGASESTPGGAGVPVEGAPESPDTRTKQHTEEHTETSSARAPEGDSVGELLRRDREWSHLASKSETIHYRLASIVGSQNVGKCLAAFMKHKAPTLPLEFKGDATAYFLKALTGFAQDRGWKALDVAEVNPDAAKASSDPTTQEILAWVGNERMPERKAIARVFSPLFAYSLAAYMDEVDDRGRLIVPRRSYFQCLADVAFREAAVMEISPMGDAQLAREIFSRFQGIRRAAGREQAKRS